jgi:hypothetical protein
LPSRFSRPHSRQRSRPHRSAVAPRERSSPDLQHEADKLTSDERTLLGDLRKLEVDRQSSEELQEVEEQESQVASELAANAERTRELEAQSRQASS